jgi:hypothetical protein
VSSISVVAPVFSRIEAIFHKITDSFRLLDIFYVIMESYLSY